MDANETVGSKRKTRRKKCDLRFSFLQGIASFMRKLLRMGLVPRESVGRTSRWHYADRKAEVEEADGNSGRQEGIGLALSFHGRELFRI